LETNKNNFDLTKFFISYQRIVDDTQMLSCTRILALRLQKQQYLTVKDFFIDLSNDDLINLLKVTESLYSGNEQTLGVANIFLITEMLTRAEGLISTDEHQLMSRVKIFCSFLTCESLARRGLVKIFRENLSFGEEMIDSIIIEKLSDIDYDSY